MPTEDAYISGHLVLSHLGNCKCANGEANLSWTCVLFPDFWVSNIPRYFFCLWQVLLCKIEIPLYLFSFHKQHSLIYIRKSKQINTCTCMLSPWRWSPSLHLMQLFILGQFFFFELRYFNDIHLNRWRFVHK